MTYLMPSRTMSAPSGPMRIFVSVSGTCLTRTPIFIFLSPRDVATFGVAATLPGVLLQDRTTDDDLLDLGRALVELRHARVAEVALDRRAAHQPVGAQQVDRGPRRAVASLRREELRHGRLLRVRQALITQPRRIVREVPRRFDIGRHGGELVLDRLQVGERRAVAPALDGMTPRGVQTGLGDAHRLGGDADAAAVQRVHGDPESLTQ